MFDLSILWQQQQAKTGSGKVNGASEHCLIPLTNGGNRTVSRIKVQESVGGSSGAIEAAADRPPARVNL